MCFGDKKSVRSASPGAMPVLKMGSRSSTPAAQQRAGVPSKLTKQRPQPTVMTERSPSFDITWPLDRPDADRDTIIYQPSSPDSLDQSPVRPFRYDEASVPPSRAASVYSRSASPCNEFTLPEKPIVVESPTRPFRPESWRTSSPLPPSPVSYLPNFSRPTSPPPALPPAPLNIRRPAPLPPKLKPAPLPPKLKPAPLPPTLTPAPVSTPGTRTAQLARSLSAKMAHRPKFSLPENLAPFSLPPAPIMKELYRPPTPPRPERTAPPERVFSPGRIAATDDLDRPGRVPYDRVKLFPIPDSIIQSGAGEAEERHRTALATALADRARERRLERHASAAASSSKHSRSLPSQSSRLSAPSSSSQGSSGSGRNSAASEEYDDFDSRSVSRLEWPGSGTAPLTQLHSRFSMSSLGSTIRAADGDGAREYGASGGMPTFPSRHEAKKARKIWLQQQEEAKRQSAKMGVEGILGWDVSKKQWVTKMTADEMHVWLEQWKKGADEKRGSAGSAGASPTDADRKSAEVNFIRV